MLGKKDQTATAGFEGGRSCEKDGSLWKPEKARKQILPESLQKEQSPANTLVLPIATHGRLL